MGGAGEATRLPITSPLELAAGYYRAFQPHRAVQVQYGLRPKERNLSLTNVIMHRICPFALLLLRPVAPRPMRVRLLFGQDWRIKVQISSEAG